MFINLFKMFWADQLALEAINRASSEGNVVCIRCGQTPSGGKHIGNLNDVVRAYFVYKAVVERGVKAKFIHSSDDRDPLKDIPRKLMDLDGKWHDSAQFELEKFLGMPLCRIPDPFGCCKSWSAHFTKIWVDGLNMLDIFPEIYFNDHLYKKDKFTPYIKQVFEKRELVSKIVSRFQESKGDNYIPFDAICPECGRLANINGFDLDNQTVSFECTGKAIKKKKSKSCGFKGEVPFSEGKLQWRFEWPAQWGIFNTTFEPFGKDHFEGSWKSGVEIAKQIYNVNPPIPFVYEFFLVSGEKMSASKGNVYVTQDILKFLEPEVFLYFYAKKPGKQRNLDLKRIFQLVDEFDEAEKIYFGLSEDKTEHKEENTKRMYEISSKNRVKHVRVPYTFCAVLSQIFGSNAVNVLRKSYLKDASPEDIKMAELRLNKAGFWAEMYIPAEERIKLLDDSESKENFANLSERQKNALIKFSGFLDLNEKELNKKLMEIVKESGITAQEFYSAAYMVLFGKERGPKLIPFIKTLDLETAKKKFTGT